MVISARANAGPDMAPAAGAVTADMVRLLVVLLVVVSMPRSTTLSLMMFVRVLALVLVITQIRKIALVFRTVALEFDALETRAVPVKFVQGDFLQLDVGVYGPVGLAGVRQLVVLCLLALG